MIRMKKNKFLDYIEMTVPFYIPISIAAAFAGITSSNGVLDFNVLLAFLSLSLLVGAFNIFNGISDRKIDQINKPKRPIPSGRITIKEAFILSVILYFISLLVASQLTTEFFLIVLASTIISIFYSLPRIKLKKRFILSNFSGAIFYGLLCPLAGWSLTPTNPIPINILGFLFILTFSLSITKDFEDVRGDKAFYVENFPIKLGIRNSIMLIALTLLASFSYIILTIFLNFLEIKYAIILLTTPAFLYFILKMLSKPKNIYNSINESTVARKFFFSLISLGIFVEILIGFIALF